MKTHVSHLVSILCVGFLFTALGTSDAISENGTVLTVGVRDGSPPFSSVNPKTGKPEGFEIDLANALSKAMDRSFKLTTITGDSRVPMLTTHEIDLAIAVFSVTPERAKRVAFSNPYFPSPAGVLVMDNSSIRKLADLPNKTNCTPKGTINQETLKNGYQKMFGPAEFGEVQLGSYQHCVLQLKQGRADMIVTDLGTLAGLARQNDSLRILDQTFPGYDNAVGIAKDRPDLVKEVNAGLAKLFADGTWEKLYLTWIGPPIPEGWPPKP